MGDKDTTTAPRVTEKDAAKLLARLKGTLTEFDSVKEAVEALKAFSSSFNDLDGKKLMEELEVIKTAQEGLVELIAKGRSGGPQVAGIEDYVGKGMHSSRPQFSLGRAVTALRMGGTKEVFEKLKAGLEYECLAAFQKNFDRTHIIKTQQAGDHGLGGSWIPDQVMPGLLVEVFTTSAFIALDAESGQTRVTVLDGLVGGTNTWPRFQGGIIAYWGSEGDAAIESMASTDDVTMTPHKLQLLAKITEEMRDFASPGFDAAWRRSMRRAVAKALDYAVPYGDGGSSQPRGIASTKDVWLYSAQADSAIKNVTASANSLNAGDWQGKQLHPDVIENIKLVFEEDDVAIEDSFAIISAPRAFSWLRKLKIDNYSGQTTGQPFLISPLMMNDARLRDVIGDFGKTTQILANRLPGQTAGATTTSTTAKYTDIFAGNFDQVLLGRWNGLEVLTDGAVGSGFPKGEEMVRMRMYADVGVAQERELLYCPDVQVRA